MTPTAVTPTRPNAIQRLLGTIHAYRARRAACLRTRTELESMSRRELAELGLSPADIPEIAARATA